MRRKSRKVLSAALALALAVACVGLPTFAQDLKGEALKQFQDGKGLKDAGDCKEAIAHFEKSLQLQPDQAGTQYYLGQCYESLGLMSSAYTHYTEAELVARKLSADPSTDKKVKAPHDAAARVDPKIDHLKIVAPTPAPAGLAIAIGESNVPSGAWNAIPVDPGTYTVHATAPGKKPWSKEIVVSGEGKTETVTVDPLVDDAASATTAPPPAIVAPVASTASPSKVRDPGPSPRRTIGLVVGIAGVAITGVGVVFGLSAKSKMSDSKDNHCGLAAGQIDPNRCDSTGLDLRDSARRQADLSTVMVIVGGAAAATGIVLILVSGGTERGHTGATASLGIRPGSIVLEGAF